MLVSERTALADAAVGTLVSIDRMDLIRRKIYRRSARMISEILKTKVPNDPWLLKVAKAITLLEFVRSVPRTEKNLRLYFNAVDA